MKSLPLRSRSDSNPREACTSDGRFTLRDFPVRKRSAKAHKTTHYKSEYESESGAVKLRQYPAFAAAKRAGRIVRRRERLQVNIAALRSRASKLIRQIGLTRFDWEPFRHVAVRRSMTRIEGKRRERNSKSRCSVCPSGRHACAERHSGCEDYFSRRRTEHASMSRLALILCDAPT
jgi:hypothetical protein